MIYILHSKKMQKIMLNILKQLLKLVRKSLD